MPPVPVEVVQLPGQPHPVALRAQAPRLPAAARPARRERGRCGCRPAARTGSCPRRTRSGPGRRPRGLRSRRNGSVLARRLGQRRRQQRAHPAQVRFHHQVVAVVAQRDRRRPVGGARRDGPSRAVRAPAAGQPSPRVRCPRTTTPPPGCGSRVNRAGMPSTRTLPSRTFTSSRVKDSTPPSCSSRGTPAPPTRTLSAKR